MTEPIHKGKDLLPVWVIHAASGGDSEAMEQVLRYYDDYMSRLCTRTLYDKNGTPHVCVDVHMKRCLETRKGRRSMKEKPAPPDIPKQHQVQLEQMTYRFGNRLFVVESIFKEESPDTLGSVLLRLMKAEHENNKLSKPG